MRGRRILRILTYQLFEGDDDARLAAIEDLCARILPQRPAGYVESRLALIPEPELFVAKSAERLVGFKLGYRLSDTHYFSWLGGVEEDCRRLGIASRLTELQHAHLTENRFQTVETRTRANNAPMLIVNLRHGFEIVGVEADPYARFIVIQRKALASIGERFRS